MNANLLSNLQALLDFHKVPSQLNLRAEYISSNCDCDLSEIKYFLNGTGNLSKGVMRKLADFFEVDVFWLLKKN